jgi:hypothetical protein
VPAVDAGFAIAATIRDAIRDSLADYELDQPGILTVSTGQETPTADACEGLIWVRVGTVFPTDGSGAMFASARPSWDVPAWCFPVEVGVLWCHQNITPDGSWIDPAQEHEFAARDGAYRMALLDAVAFRWRPTTPADPLYPLVLGQSLLPWTPIGPQGNYSGGIVVTQVITSALGLCDD